AGGCILACCGDRRLIAEGARIGAPELRVGVPFPASPLEIIRYACGGHTEEVVYSGKLFSGADAVRVGIAHEVVPAEELRARAVADANDLATLAPLPFRLAKAQLRRPTVDRIREYADTGDREVVDIWRSDDAATVIRGYLDRTIGKG